MTSFETTDLPERLPPETETGRERVRALGGTVAIHGAKGMRLDIRLPLRTA